jgi:serine/threonine protein kinase
MYEMATGVSPFGTESVMATMRRLVDESPQAMASLNPELPPWFIAIVDRLLEKEPPRRFGSAKEVSELLEGCLAHIQQPASVSLPVALPKPAPQSLSGRRRSLFKGAMALFATLGIGLFAWILFSPPERGGEAGEFGPVVDQELNVGHLPNKSFFRFLMGKESAKSSTKEEKLSDAWFAKQGINALGDRESTAPRLVGLGCVFLRIDEPQAWATLSADAARRA